MAIASVKQTTEHAVGLDLWPLIASDHQVCEGRGEESCVWYDIVGFKVLIKLLSIPYWTVPEAVSSET